MTDKKIDEVVAAIIPDLRIAVTSLLTGAPVHIFNAFAGKNSITGVETKIVLFLAHEVPGIVLESVVNGMGEANKRQEELLAEMRSKALQERAS